MKSRRRHELQTNELADALGRAIAWAKPRGRQIEIVLACILVVVLVMVLVPGPWKGAGRGETAAWAFAQATRPGTSPEAVRSFLEEHPDAPQAPAAKIALAHRLVADVVDGSEPDEAPPTEVQVEVDLAEAEAMCEQVRDASEPYRPMAEFLLGLIAIQRGDLDEGREALRRVAQVWPDSVAAAGARAHLEELATYEPEPFSTELLPTAEEAPEAPGPEAADQPEEVHEAAPPEAEPEDVPERAPEETSETAPEETAPPAESDQ